MTKIKKDGTGKRFTLDQVVEELETDKRGIDNLTRLGYFRPVDERILRAVTFTSEKYGLNGIEKLLREAEKFTKLHFSDKPHVMTVSQREIDKVRNANSVGYRAALGRIMGFDCTKKELERHNGGLLRAINTGLKPVKIGGKEVYFDRNIKTTKNDVSQKPSYTQAISYIITDRVAEDVLTSLKSNDAIVEFCEQFRITEAKVQKYLANGRLRTGGANVVDEVLRAASREYPHVTLVRSRVREACTNNDILQEATNYDTISNVGDFVESLVSISDLTHKLYGEYRLLVQMAQTYLSTHHEKLPLVKVEGTQFIHKDDEDDIKKTLQNIPLNVRKEHLRNALGCRKSDLEHFRDRFSCLTNGTLLDSEGAAQFIQDLEGFKEKLYDPERIVSELDSWIAVSDDALVRMVEQSTRTKRVFCENKLHEDDALPIINAVNMTSKRYEAFAEHVLGWIDRGYASLSPSMVVTMKVDEETLEKESISSRCVKKFGVEVADAISDKTFLYRSRTMHDVDERAYLADVEEALRDSEHITVLGLCAQIDLENCVEIERRVNYVMRNLGIEPDQSIRDPNNPHEKYISQEQAQKVKAAIDELEEKSKKHPSAPIGMYTRHFMTSVGPSPKNNYYTRAEVEKIFDGKKIPVKPTIDCTIGLYSAEDLADGIKANLPEDFRAFVEKSKSSPYELLIMKAQRSRALSHNRWQVKDGERDEAVIKLLKLPKGIYDAKKKIVDATFTAYSSSQLE